MFPSFCIVFSFGSHSSIVLWIICGSINSQPIIIILKQIGTECWIPSFFRTTGFPDGILNSSQTSLLFFSLFKHVSCKLSVKSHLPFLPLLPDQFLYYKKGEIAILKFFVILFGKPFIHKGFSSVQLSSVQLLSRVWLFATPWTTPHQASPSITNSRSSPKPMSIELVMPSNHLILCRPLLLLPLIFPNIRVFSNESALPIRWPKY